MFLCRENVGLITPHVQTLSGEEGVSAEDGDTAHNQDNFRCGGVNETLENQFQLVFTHAKLEELFRIGGFRASKLPKLMDGTGGGFFFVRGISIWLAPRVPGWDEPVLDFSRWASKILGLRSSTLKTRFAAIRLMHLISGNVDFSIQAHRAKAMTKGLKKREGVQRKHPFSADLLRLMQTELVRKGGERSGGRGSMYTEMFTACGVGFLFLLRISELESLRWEDVCVGSRGGERFPTLRIKKPKKDVSRGGIARSLIDVDSCLFPVKAFLAWAETSRDSPNGEITVSGVNLRSRVSAVMKMADVANGVVGARIDTHSLRDGGPPRYIRKAFR